MTDSKAAQDNLGGRRLVVCVDDFGYDEAVDASVLALARQGRISATGVLVDAPAWPGDAAALREEADRGLGVGLHLNLSEGFPGSPAGATLEWAPLVLRACARQLDREWLRAEVDRQLDAFHRGMGRAPDFVDGHRHVHQLPQVRTALVDALQARGWRPWLRSTLPVAGAAAEAGDAFKERVIAALGGGALVRLARKSGLRTNRAMVGVYGFDGLPAQHLERLARWLGRARDGDLLMCHTAAGPVSSAGDPIAQARRVEHEVLSGEAFGRLLQALDVRISPVP